MEIRENLHFEALNNLVLNLQCIIKLIYTSMLYKTKSQLNDEIQNPNMLSVVESI